MSARRLIQSIFLFAVLCLARGARAVDVASGPPPEAKKAFADGKAAFERGDYETALQMFQRAMLIAPAPSLYYNIGVAYERLYRYEDSAIAFETYLREMDAPTTDEDRKFQADLRARAAANREKARTLPPPPRRIEPSPPPNAYPQAYPGYAYPTYVPPSAIYTPPPLTHRQKLEAARRHRNNGIALTVIGSIFVVTGCITTGLTAGPLTVGDDSLVRGLAIWGGTIPLIAGVPILIPGVVALAKWQKELNAETKRPDDGAGAAKAAIDLAAPPMPTSNGPALVLGTPPIRF